MHSYCVIYNHIIFCKGFPSTCRRLSTFLLRMMSTEQCKQVWKSVDAVCFDVDSTVLQDEALDELAKFCGVGDEVVEW